MGDPRLKQAIKNAAHYLAIGQIEIYLMEPPYPWDYVTKVVAGGSHRLDMDTSVHFTAPHPCGLTFEWTFDIEERDANGRGYYRINTVTTSAVVRALSPAGKRQFAGYLRTCAQQVGGKAQEYQAHADKQRDDAAQLFQLAALAEGGK